MAETKKPEPLRFRFDGKDIVRHWQAWLDSEEGKSCLRGDASGVYLENRLNAAFDAGMEAALALVDGKKVPLA